MRVCSWFSFSQPERHATMNEGNLESGDMPGIFAPGTV